MDVWNRMTGLAIAAAAIFAALVVSPAAKAQSVAQCQQQCSITEGMCKGIGDGRDASCNSDADACRYQCVLNGSSSGSSSGSSGRAPPKFGAIAFSAKTQARGFSYDWANRASAEASAMKACRSDRTPAPKDCAVTIWFYNNCGALSTSGDGGWGAGYGSSRRQAEANAVQYCRNAGGTSCAVRRSYCTGL